MSTETARAKPSVLLSFRARNVRSFRDEFEFSLLATRTSEKPVVRSITWSEVGHSLDVLPGAVMFGANASGKSNVLRAMEDMRNHVLHSFRSGDPNGGIPRHPFRLDEESAAANSLFEVNCIVDGVRYEYGFEINSQAVEHEWAFHYPRGKARLVFSRDRSALEHGPAFRIKGRLVEELLRPNALFLSTAAAANHEALLPLYAWFRRNLVMAAAENRDLRQARTTELVADSETQPHVLALLRAADLGITDVRKVEMDPDFVELRHQGTHGDAYLDISEESLGTLVWLGVIGPIIDALREGTVLLADDVDASLHPMLVEQLVRLFQDPDTNPHHAQLLFNSHEASLLGDSTSERLLGRDQVWFTEKLPTGATRLYPLNDFDPRKNESVGRRYREGRYGAVPIVSQADFAAIINDLAGAPS